MRRPLSTHELVEAAVLADVSVLLVVAGWFLPASAAFWAAAVVPLAIVVVRHRLRALVVGGCAGAAVASLALGFGMVLQMSAATLVAFVVGTAVRRRWGVVRTVAFALVVGWTPVSAFFVGFFALFSASRKLTLEQLRIQWTGTKRVARQVIPRAADVVARTHANPAFVAVALELLPVALGVGLSRGTRRAQRVVLGVVAAAYTAVACAFDVWAGLLAAAALAAGYIGASRWRERRARTVIVRVWVAVAATTVAAGALGGRGLFIATLDAQWRVVRRATATVIAAGIRVGDTGVGWFLVHWWFAIPLSLLGVVLGVTVVARAITIPVLARVERGGGGGPAGGGPLRCGGACSY
jgi:hypothetical protein